MKKEEIIDLLLTKDSTKLFERANKIRHKYVGDEIHLRALIEFSNICKRQCLYCGLRSENKNIERYRLNEDEILTSVKKAVDLEYKTIVLQSGEDSFYDVDKLSSIIKKIKKYDVAVTLSIGERTYEEYKALKQAGADRYLLRIETTDKKLYNEMHPNSNFENRINCLENLKSLDYEVGTGCLVGLPNQTIESLANDIMFFQDIDADMIGVGPFIPHTETPLNHAKQGDFYLALKVMAITRILLPTINIPATTAMETIMQNGRLIALNSGANVIMPNLTNLECRKNYQIYPNKAGIYENDSEYRQQIEQKILSIGRTISTNKGFRKK